MEQNKNQGSQQQDSRLDQQTEQDSSRQENQKPANPGLTPQKDREPETTAEAQNTAGKKQVDQEWEAEDESADVDRKSSRAPHDSSIGSQANKSDARSDESRQEKKR